MRSIGKVNIRKLKAIISDEVSKMPKYDRDYRSIEEKVIERCPSEWWDIWEMAYQEIHRIIDDELSKVAYGR